MNILITNDDGYLAPGINALYDVLGEKHNVFVVAPSTEKSATGHSMTLHHPLRANEIKRNYYSVDGFPADCVYLGLHNLFESIKFDLVVSGINNGANLGQDTYYSGTVAGAREALYNGVPSIAISLCYLDKFKRCENGYIDAARYLLDNIEIFLALRKENNLININYPNLRADSAIEYEVTRPGFMNYAREVIERDDQRGRKYFWIGGRFEGVDESEGTDTAIITSGKVSVSFINQKVWVTDKL